MIIMKSYKDKAHIRVLSDFKPAKYIPYYMLKLNS